MRKLLAALAVFILPHAAWAACANTVTAKDGAGASVTFCKGTDGGTNSISAISIMDAAGAVQGSAANPFQVVIATDQPALTNPQPGNFAQIGGTAVSVNSGLTDAGTQRVVNGASNKKRLSGLTNTVTTVKASAAGALTFLHCNNTNSSQVYVQVFDVATSGGVTLGTTAPDLSFSLPATNSDGFALAGGFSFANGIQVAATTTATGSTAPSTAIDCNAGYN